MMVVDKIPTQDMYENTLKGGMDSNKKSLNRWVNELVYKDLILFVNTDSSVWMVVFGLVEIKKVWILLRETEKLPGIGL